jgi:hypothetical protein
VLFTIWCIIMELEDCQYTFLTNETDLTASCIYGFILDEHKNVQICMMSKASLASLCTSNVLLWSSY